MVLSRVLRSLVAPLGLGVGLMYRRHARADAVPVLSRADVSRRARERDGPVLVTVRDRVYDVTDVVESHPGGREKLLLASGGAVEPFWNVYRTHYTSPAVQAMLSGRCVGVLAAGESHGGGGGGGGGGADSEDPYAREPARSERLIVHSDKPCNAECPPSLHCDSWITPTPLWFVRHHHPVPHIDVSEWRLVVEGALFGARAPPALDMAALKRLEKTSVVATLQCGGNRRAEMNAVAATSGIGWGAGAVSTARWGGVRLREYLGSLHPALRSVRAAERAGVRHVIFESADGVQASIPIQKALDECGDVLLAYEMNDAPLPADHGCPLRAIVPGHVGIRNVKWLTKIRLDAAEARGPWQRGIAYKGFSPNVTDFAAVDAESVLSIQETPVQSVIATPRDGDEIPDAGPGAVVEVAGWAWSGGGRGIARVDVSGDGGRTWHTAELGAGSDQHPARAWAWTFWRAAVPATPDSTGAMRVCCRATDAAYNVQPPTVAPFWNKRGLNNTAWHTIRLHAQEAKPRQATASSPPPPSRVGGSGSR